MKLFLSLFTLLSLSLSAQEYSQLREMADEKKINLSVEDQKILQQGEMSTTSYVIGGILGTYPLGLGIGHAIQGRYSDKGWIFTVGEIGALAVALAGVSDCVGDLLDEDKDCNSGLVTLGVVGFVGFRIWEIIDLWATPLSNDRKYRNLKDYINSKDSKKEKLSYNFAPFLSSEKKLGLGLAIRF